MADDPCAGCTRRDLDQLEARMMLVAAAARDQQGLYNAMTDLALKKSDDVLSTRLDALNHVKAQLADFVRADVWSERHRILEVRLSALESERLIVQSRLDDAKVAVGKQQWLWGIGVSLVALMLSTAHFFVRAP